MNTSSSKGNTVASGSPAEILEVVRTLQHNFNQTDDRLTQVEEATKVLAASQKKMGDKLDGICQLLLQWISKT
jgi:hypothetical protein